jgi:hypothetical protein
MNEHPDLNDDDLPGDDAPPEIETVPEDRRPDPSTIPPDEGDADAELKEQGA